MKAINIQWDVDYEDGLENLPTEIEIPDEVVDGVDEYDYCDVISDYITDVTGFCHFGYDLEG